MRDRLLTDAPLSEQAKGLLASTRMPLYKMLNVQVAYQHDPSIIDVESYADVLATDLLFQYLQENLAFLQAASTALPFPVALLDTFKSGVVTAMESVRAKAQEAHAQTSTALQLIEQTQLLEQMLAGSLSTDLANNVEWARSLH